MRSRPRFGSGSQDERKAAGPVDLIDGRSIAAAITTEVAAGVAELRAARGTPVLAVVVPTRDEATAWYVRSIIRAAARVELDCQAVQLGDPSPAELTGRLDELSADPAVHGVICQTPLPAGLSLAEAGAHIAVA